MAQIPDCPASGVSNCAPLVWIDLDESSLTCPAHPDTSQGISASEPIDSALRDLGTRLDVVEAFMLAQQRLNASPAHLLVLNINMKHGHDGLVTLRSHGVTVPPTPFILTPHDGFAYMFRPPDREQYPFPL